MRKWRIALAAGAVVLGCAGCGTQGADNMEPTGAVSVSEELEENTEVQEAENEEIESAERQNGPAEGQVEEKNGNYNDLEDKGENGEIAAFAEQIQDAVSNKDMDALADLCAYPLAVNDEMIESRDAFMELGADVIFTEERCAVIAAVDISALEETMAGVIMGDATPNIIFKSVDGKLGIAGIN